MTAINPNAFLEAPFMPLFRETPEAITRSWEPLTGLLYADKPIIYPFIIPQRPEIVSSQGGPL